MSSYKPYLIIDVETRGYPANEDVCLAHFKKTWKPAKNLVDEQKIDEAREKALQDYSSRRALIPGENELLAISICDPDTMKADALVSKSEKEILEWWLDVCAQYSPQSIHPVGFNIKFDLTTIMFSMYRHKLSLPRKVSKWAPVDLMYELNKKGGFKGSLKAWATRMGHTTSGVDGSQVGELWEQGKFEELYNYAIEDAVNTAHLFNCYRTINEA